MTVDSERGRDKTVYEELLMVLREQIDDLRAYGKEKGQSMDPRDFIALQAELASLIQKYFELS